MTGFVFEKEGKGYCIVIKKDGDNGFKEGYFTDRDEDKDKGKDEYKINGKSCKRAHDPGSPESGPWRPYGPDWSGVVSTYEKDGWVKSPLTSCDGPIRRL